MLRIILTSRFSTAKATEPHATDVAFVAALLASQYMLFASWKKVAQQGQHGLAVS